MEYAAGGELSKRSKKSKGIQVIPALMVPTNIINRYCFSGTGP